MIDAHVHYIPQRNSFGQELKFDFNDIRERFEKTQELEKIVLMPMLTEDANSLQINKSFLFEIEKNALAKQLFPLLWFHPNQLSVKLASEPLVAGIKFHPSISQKQINEALEIVDLAAKISKPLMIHCGRGPLSRIDYILKINENYPDVKFICAHMGGLANELILSAIETLKEVKMKKNIFFDTSGCLNPKLLKKGIEVLGANHIMFGTDTPFFDLDVSLYAIKISSIAKDDLDYILHKTAETVFG